MDVGQCVRQRRCGFQQTSVGVFAAVPCAITELQIVAVFNLAAAFNGNQSAAVGKQAHRIGSSAPGKAGKHGSAVTCPSTLDRIIVVPLLLPVEAGRSEGCFVLDKQNLDFEPDADFAFDIQLCTGGSVILKVGQEQEVDVCADISVNTEFQRCDGSVEAKAGKRIDRYADRRVNQHELGGRLAHKGNFQAGVRFNFKRYVCRYRTAEEVLRPFILHTEAHADAAAAEVDLPLFGRDIIAGLEDERSGEVGAEADFSAIVVIVVIVAAAVSACYGVVGFVHRF